MNLNAELYAADLYENRGMTIEQIARRLNLSRYKVHNALRERGVKMRPRGLVPAEESAELREYRTRVAAERARRAALREEMARAYEAGCTVHEIATIYGVSASPVYSALKSQGVRMRPRGQRPGETSNMSKSAKAIVAMMREGRHNQAEVAKALGCTRQNVNDIWRRWKDIAP